MTLPITLRNVLSYAFLITGCALLSINIFGLFQDIRPSNFSEENLLFANDQPLAYAEVLPQLKKRENESDAEFSHRVTLVISKGLAHIHWEKYEPEQFNQRVPIWENYFIYFMSKLTNIPEYQKYHFANYKRSLKRGIGICGDASMVLSQVLTENNIQNKILTYPKHVVVEANLADQQSYLLDADFGLKIPYAKEQTKDNADKIEQIYLAEGYTFYDKDFFATLYAGDYQEWLGVKHFITNKYYFEKVSYWLKWPFPLFMILLFFFLRKKGDAR